MQGHSQSARTDRQPINPPLLSHMPYHPEANLGIQDKAEAVRLANKAASLMNNRILDNAVIIAKHKAP